MEELLCILRQLLKLHNTNFTAQARALRAFLFQFQLLTYFSDLSSDAAPGVMLVDFVPAPDQDIPRSTNGQVFSFIESDLAFAQANLINPTGAYSLLTVTLLEHLKQECICTEKIMHKH
jgi:hypothetical protein